MSYSKEFKIVVATIYGEADASSVRSWEVIAHSMRNRIGFGNWTQYSTIYGIATTTGYDAYTSKNIPYYEAMSQFNSGNISNLLKKVIDTVLPIYEGKVKDDTNGVVSYWSPEAQKQLHRDKPKLYTTAVPDWVKDNKKEIVKIAGTEKDDFQWLRFKRSKMFITLRDNKGLPMDGVGVDIRFASGKKVPVLSNLKTNSKGQLPVFFARIEMGARFIVDGNYIKDKKGNNLKILPTGKDIVATIIVGTGNGFQSSLEKHETESENTQVRNDTVGINNTPKTNTASNLEEVTFNIKLVEADTGKSIPNTTYYLEYKNNIKPHKTDSSGVESGIKADVSQSISVYLDDDGGKKQSIYSMAFPVTGDLNGQTKVLKVPVVSFRIKFVDNSNQPIPHYEFKTLYRGRQSAIKRAKVQGIAHIKALAGQQLTLIDGQGRAKATAIITDSIKQWVVVIDKNISIKDISTISNTLDETASHTSKVNQKENIVENKKREEKTQIQVEKFKVKETEKKTKHGPTLEVESDQTEVTIKFTDEKTNKPISGLSYITKSAEYGENISVTGKDGTRGRPHGSLVGVEITVLVNEDGKKVKKDSFITNSDKEKTYVYKTKKPKNYLYPLPINATADYKSGMRSFGSNRDKGKRKHAGADLYAPAGTTVIAMESGIVLSAGSFYAGTDFVTIKHQNHIIRYGELAPGSIKVKAEDEVTRGQPIGAVGKLRGINVPSNMLHLEMYSNTSDTSNLTVKGTAGGKFKRRSDLINPNYFLDNADK